MSRTYDACVIGSGAAGGVMAKELCEAGAKVILLEAGQKVAPSQFRSHCWPYDMEFRGLRAKSRSRSIRRI
jgi:choline dehydrogenase-like flavoprotein